MKATDDELAVIEGIIRSAIRNSWTINETAWEHAEKAMVKIKDLINEE